MNPHTIGDLAQSFVLRRQNNTLSRQMDRLTQELSSGRPSDITRHLSGNFHQLAEIDHELRVLSSHRSAADEVRVDLSVMQASLDRMQSLSSDLSSAALSASVTIGFTQLTAVAGQANGNLDAIISSLNTDVGGRSLFAGADVDGAPLVTADTLMTEVRSTLSGAASVSDILTALDTFFDIPGGGFDSLIYQGGTSNLAPYQLGSGESVALDLRADDPAFREVMKQTVLAAVITDVALPISLQERADLAKRAGEGLLLAQDQVTSIRSALGFAEARVDQSASRIAAETTSLQIARNDLVGIDQFETATELETVQLQLETLYTLTARTARLSLVNFLS